MPTLRHGFLTLFVTFCFSNSTLAKSNQKFSIGISAGSPHVTSLDLSFSPWRFLVVGIAVGTFPLNQTLQRQVPVSEIPLSLGTSDSYVLVPSTSFTFTTTSAFLRAFPFPSKSGSGFFVEANFTRWNIRASVFGSLRNETTGESLSGAVNGNLTFNQPLLTGALGYQFAFFKRVLFRALAGVSYTLQSQHTTSIGGTLTSVLPFVDSSAEANFEQAKTDLNTQIDHGVQTAQSVTRVLPAFQLSIAWTFG